MDWIDRSIRCALSVVVFAVPNVGLAQQTNSSVIEEVIVTAQKREERLQETPVSVTAFTADAIEALGIQLCVDLNG